MVEQPTLHGPRFLELGATRAASLDLPQVGLRDFAEEDRLRLGRTVHHDEPRTPDWGRDTATRRDEPRFGSWDLPKKPRTSASGAVPDDGHPRWWRIPRRYRKRRAMPPAKPTLSTEHDAPLIVGPAARADASESASCCDFGVGLKARRPNDTKFSGERSESAATRC